MLESLVKQDFDGEFEVIVVDDGSSDDTMAMLEQMASTVPYRLVALAQPRNLGPSSARNRGWRTARAPLVCFTDDDCVASPRWLAELTQALEHADIVQGQTLPNPEHEHHRGPFSHTLHVVSEHGWYETCNMGYRREVLERLDGFDESFRFAYGEDAELAWRAKRSGARSAFAAEALILHEIVPSRWSGALKRTRRREGIVQVFQRSPGLKQQLGKGVFYERTHLPALVVVACAAGLTLAPKSRSRWLVSAVVGLWYAWECRKNHAKPKWGNVGYLAVVPGALVVDLADIAVLAGASVRYRLLQL
jgi:GT2 family glycosyltransferase